MALLLNAGDTVSRSYSYTQPSPLHPSQPQGTGERTGNLWAGDVPQYSYAKDYKKYNPDNAVYIKAGTYTISSDGKLPNIQAFDDNHTQYSISEIMTFPSAYYSVWNGLSISPISAVIHTATITILADCIITLTVVDNLGTYIMLNTGSTPLPYEKFGYKIPISSANTTIPVYLGEVQTTRKIKKLVLDGTESWTYESQYSRFVLIRTDAYYSSAVRTTPCNCSHYQPIYDGRTIDNVPNESIYITSSSGRTAFNIKSTDFTSVTDFKAWLAAQYAAGTPVTVWYVLANEETAVVNEPLMKIGDYADTVSGISIPVTAGENTISIGTTVQPSEVTVGYKGWHPVQSVHERTNGQWD